MKKSNLILLCFILAILATILVSAVTLRMKMNKRRYAKFIPPQGSVTDFPLGAFSVVVIDGIRDVTITPWPNNVIHLPQRESMRPSYRLGNDTLFVKDTADGEGNLQLNASVLRSVWLKNVNNSRIAGFNGDSLTITALNSENVFLAGLTVGRLHLQADTAAEVTLSHVDCQLFQPFLTSAGLSIDSSSVHNIRGRWDAASNLKLDGYSLNRIEKIEHQ